MSGTTVITLKNILIPESMIIAFASHIIPEFYFMKVDYVLLINAASMFFNFIDQICDAR